LILRDVTIGASTIKNRFLTISLLVLSGEAVFFLPFVLVRIFRPTYLDVFTLDNTQLGFCFSIYGVVAFLSYFFGGVLADKFEPRLLIVTALILTGLGGFYLATYPSYTELKILYAYWGFTTIFLLWGAMIKATRIWGGNTKQGRAFGFLDGGRGAVSATIGATGVVIYGMVMTVDIDTATLADKQAAFKSVILASTYITLGIAVLVFLFLKQEPIEDDVKFDNHTDYSKKNILAIAKLPFVWLLALIILCAYCGYKVTDIFSLTANEVMLYDEVDAAKVGTLSLYLRPFVGVIIGFLADRTKASLVLTLSFSFVIIGSLLFASGLINSSAVFFFFMAVVITSIGIYSARVLYFAVIHEGNIPVALTGTAVGIVSVVGYTPDIFMGPVIGYILDSSPGLAGHQHVYLTLAGFSIVGLVSSFLLKKNIKSQVPKQ